VLGRHKGSPTFLSYRAQGEGAKARLDELSAKEKAKLQGFKCPHCGYDYGPFDRPFFEGIKKGHFRLECAVYFQGFVSDGPTLAIIKVCRSSGSRGGVRVI